ncbi:CIC11C00000004139 [Sungouiella intermedia]|uniref:CIC11C00000004139 n=1 Tax=Sungouiella intermedia TaxID=45354 RepID=A0A1L0BZJ6_9ASCO|nr:CIC11C00000004139 [[Candida] intermedia]
MSLEHEELLMDKISAHADDESKLTPEEKNLKKLMDSKQKVMVDQSRSFMETLFSDNSTLPVKIKNVQVTNAENFRDSFLLHQLQPLLSKDLYTLADFFSNLDVVHRSLVKHDILENCVISLHQLPKNMWTNSSPATVDMVPVFNILPQKRFYAKTGTNIGNGEGDGYIQFQLKNLFGGAESLVFDAVTGTKTPSSYLLNYSQPVFDDANYLLDTQVYVNTRKIDWIQSSVTTRGFTTKVSTRYDSNLNYSAAFETCWRSLQNHNSRSMEVMSHLKDTFKSSLIFNMIYDTRDNHVLPTVGNFFKFGFEQSGLFSFNNIKFSKLIWESQSALKLNSNHSLVFSNKAGLLFGTGSSGSNILDRFHIGGPNDVRSFRVSGLGPVDNGSALGGNYFLNGGVSLVSQIPWAPKDTNFKFHNFFNFGKILPALGQPSFKSLVSELTGTYSSSIGTGILYNHPMARFELNFVLPITAHANEYVRKGIQYGVGVSFL